MEIQELIQVEPNPRVEEFGPGDSVRVSVRVVEGSRSRTQDFEGVVIRRRGVGIRTKTPMWELLLVINLSCVFLVSLLLHLRPPDQHVLRLS